MLSKNVIEVMATEAMTILETINTDDSGVLELSINKEDGVRIHMREAAFDVLYPIHKCRPHSEGYIEKYITVTTPSKPVTIFALHKEGESNGG